MKRPEVITSGAAAAALVGGREIKQTLAGQSTYGYRRVHALIWLRRQ
jgi:hypothetical protein